MEAEERHRTAESAECETTCLAFAAGVSSLAKPFQVVQFSYFLLGRTNWSLSSLLYTNPLRLDSLSELSLSLWELGQLLLVGEGALVAGS